MAKNMMMEEDRSKARILSTGDSTVKKIMF